MLLRQINQSDKLYFSCRQKLYSYNLHTGTLKSKSLGNTDWLFEGYYHDYADAMLSIEPFEAKEVGA